MDAGTCRLGVLSRCGGTKALWQEWPSGVWLQEEKIGHGEL